MENYTLNSLYKEIAANNNRYVSNFYQSRRELHIDEDISELKKDSEVFVSKIHKQNRFTDSTYSESKLQRNINSFIKEYNSYIKKVQKSGNSKISKKLDELIRLVEDNSKTLKQVGISKDKGGQLKFNKEKFEKAKKKDFGTLFGGNESLLNKVSKIGRSITNIASNIEYSEEIVRYRPTTIYSTNDIQIVGLVNNLTSVLNLNSENLGNYQDEYVSSYNKLIKSNGNMAKNIISETKRYELDLNNVGIKINESDNTLMYDDTSASSDALVLSNSLKKLYDAESGTQGNGEYAKKINDYCMQIAHNILKPEHLGVIIDSEV